MQRFFTTTRRFAPPALAAAAIALCAPQLAVAAGYGDGTFRPYAPCSSQTDGCVGGPASAEEGIGRWDIAGD